MKKLHAKSPCCRAKIIRFGERRKQCIVCKKTWRARKKKRGPKRSRISSSIVTDYFSHILPSFYGYAKKHKCSPDIFEYRLQKSRDLFIKTTTWPSLPQRGNLILIADVKKKKLCGKLIAVYIILVRAVDETIAYAHKPHIEEGDESVEGWDRAFDTLPENVKDRVSGLVCDGHRGLILSAKWRGWKLQRCHFHLLKSFIVRRSTKSTRGNAEIGKQIIELAKTILSTTDKNIFYRSVSELEAIGWEVKRGSLGAVISGFLNHIEEYRTYLLFPELRLPRTSNSAESFIGGFQSLLSQAHGFRTKKSFVLWVEAYVKWRKNISCKPSNYQPN